MRQSFDPLTFIPSSDTIRKHLAQAEGLVKRLRVLLRIAGRIEATRESIEEKPICRKKGAHHDD